MALSADTENHIIESTSWKPVTNTYKNYDGDSQDTMGIGNIFGRLETPLVTSEESEDNPSADISEASGEANVNCRGIAGTDEQADPKEESNEEPATTETYILITTEDDQLTTTDMPNEQVIVLHDRNPITLN